MDLLNKFNALCACIVRVRIVLYSFCLIGTKIDVVTLET